MFCRRVWQRVGPLAWRVLSPTSRSVAPVRHMAFGVPGGSTNMTYFVLCGGGLTAAVVYAYKSVNGDADRQEDKFSNMNSAAKVGETPAAEPAAEEEQAPGAEVIVGSLPAETVEETLAEPVEESASEVVVTEASVEPVVSEEEPAAEAAAEPVEETSAEPVEDSASEVVLTEASVEQMVSEEDAEPAAEAAGSPGMAAVDEAPPPPPADPETPSEAPEAEAAPAAEVAA